MLKQAKPYTKVFKLTWSSASDYRMNFIFNFICSFIPIIAMLFLWKAIYSSNAKIGNYDMYLMFSYVILSRFLYLLIVPDFFFDVTDEIESGNLSNYIVRPINYLKLWFFKALGSKSQGIVSQIIPMLLILIICNKEISFNLSLRNFVLLVITSAISYILYFLIFMSVSLLNFWFYEISSWFYTVSFVIEFLSGVIIPIDLLPDILQQILKYLPFKYLIYFPIKTFVGSASTLEIIYGIMIQLIWTIISLILLHFLWMQGRKKYDAYGG